LQIEQFRSVALFLGSLRQGIHRFKYEKLSSLADPFGAMLADYWRTNHLTADGLIPVPLHPSRERDRGYNQSNLLAQRLAAQVGVRVLSKGLRRTRVTAVQLELNAAQRKENVSGAFACDDQRVRGAGGHHRRCLHDRRDAGSLCRSFVKNGRGVSDGTDARPYTLRGHTPTQGERI
jgi:predicted amidophosphoribosyltransferase